MSAVLAQIPEYSGETETNTVIEAILTRHSVSPKRIAAPGPDAAQLDTLLRAAAAAPDHGKLRPWRFICFPESTRDALADVFARALLERWPDAPADAVERAREKSARGPVLLGLVLRIESSEGAPAAIDQHASGGAALQNVLLAAHAMGFGARALSGLAVQTEAFRKAVGLGEDEVFLCFIPIGTPTSGPKCNPRPAPETLLSHWAG